MNGGIETYENLLTAPGDKGPFNCMIGAAGITFTVPGPWHRTVIVFGTRHDTEVLKPGGMAFYHPCQISGPHGLLGIPARGVYLYHTGPEYLFLHKGELTSEDVATLTAAAQK